MPSVTLLSKSCFTFCILLSFIAVASAQGNFSNITDTSDRPVVFAPGVVSSPFEEVAATFTPDANTVYFAEGTIAMEIATPTG